MADKNDWREITSAADLDEVIGDGSKAWALYEAAKAAYREYKAARDRFEAAMQEGFADYLSAEQELKFGYMFGKLSIATGPKRERKAAAKRQAGSLSDWLDARVNSGHRA